jgi:hypothetical protein
LAAHDLLPKRDFRILLLGPGKNYADDWNKRQQIKQALHSEGYVGAILGDLGLVLLTQTTFQPVLVDFIREHDFTNTFQDMISQAKGYGWVNLIIGCLTIVPQNVCLVGGILIGLNPFVVFTVVALIKWLRILVVILLVKQAVKTGVFLQEKMHLKDYWKLVKSFFRKERSP